MVPLSWYLIVAALLFCIGLYGVMARRNAVAILMSVELMLNAVNINLVAFWRYLQPELQVGVSWAIFVIAVAAAEAAVGLAIVLLVYRNWQGIETDHYNIMKW